MHTLALISSGLFGAAVLLKAADEAFAAWRTRRRTERRLRRLICEQRLDWKGR